MYSIKNWIRELWLNQVEVEKFTWVADFMSWLEKKNYQVGEQPSVYVFSQQSNITELRANLYFGKIGLLKIIIHLNNDNLNKSKIVIQKIKKAEGHCIKIQSISKQIENEWEKKFAKKTYLVIDNGIEDLKSNLEYLTEKIINYVGDPFQVQKVLDCATFLEDVVKQKYSRTTEFVSIDNMLDYRKADNIVHVMKKGSILKLTGNAWYLTVNGDYFNGYAQKQYQVGNIYSENNNNNFIFKGQDNYINPFYESSITYNPSKLDIKTISDRTDFRLISFEVFKGYLKDINFEFGADKEIKSGEPFVTILIGSNGTGKTRALSNIELIFQDLNTLKTEKKSLGKIEYNIKYKIGELLHDITIKEEKKVFLINGNEVSIKEVQLPQKLLACSYNVDDKFTFKSYSELDDEKKDDFYEYLGIKSASNAVHVGAASKKLALNIIRLKDNKTFLKKLNEILSFLGLSSILKLKLKIDEKILTSSGINFERVNDAIDKKNKDIKESDKPIQEEDINIYFDYLRKKESEFLLEKQSSNLNLLEINYEINSEDSIDEKIKDELDIVYILLKLKIIVAQGIECKKKEFFRVELASSGENHLLFEMINILSSIKENSIILIDEPEISLHPNWQYQYIELINKVFNDSSCHFIIATHSHFMVSDLKPDSSAIVFLKYNKDEGNVQAELHDEKTFGWSTEDVLYSIFRMKTVRNHYIEADLRKVLGLISTKSKDYNEIKRILDKLKVLSVKAEDPINLIIMEIERYLNEND